ncbi:MAG: heme-binding protein [Hyphomicrobiales bacterium]|nr:heme-binding protein [Hyphomicrobiales bacterium]
MRTKPGVWIAGTLLSVVATSSFADDESYTNFRVLKPELALEAAQGAMADCRERGYQVAVSITDRFGVLQVTVRDQLAGAHTPDTAYRKAWTAVSFRTETSALAQVTETGDAWAVRNVTGALPLAGGVRILAGDGDMVGAIGVSGAPSGNEDEACAKAGIEAIADRIAF